jgi:ligand-binding sensor domain-containing protein
MKNLISFFILFLIAFYSVIIRAQSDFWQKINGPIGDTLSAVGINASGTVLLGSGRGLFRSTDDGTNWSRSDSNIISPYRFAFDSIGTILCADWDGVFRSTDDGVNWTNIYNFNGIKALLINDSGDIFVGWGYESGGGVERSTDNGASWINTGLEANSYALAINTVGTIFSGGWYPNGACVFRSIDNGLNWTNTGSLGIYYPVEGLAISSTNHIFAGTASDGIYRSTDDGENWFHSNLMTASSITALAINTNGHIFAGIFNEGVYRSTDDGINWTQINSGLTNVTVVSISINPSGIIFAVTSGGLFRSVQSTTSVRYLSTNAPIGFSLNQNYPNPFNPSTTISFYIPNSSFVNLKVYDILGNEVATLVNEEKATGSYELNFNALELSSGIYFYKLQAGNFIETKKMILLK